MIRMRDSRPAQLLSLLFLALAANALIAKETDIQIRVEDHFMNGRKTVAIIIAPENFRDEELFVPRQEFEKAGFITVVASTQIGTATGMLGGTVTVQTLIPDLRPENLSALVIVGGSGAPKYLYESKPLRELILKMSQLNRPIAAICLSPAVLAKAGILKNRQATVYKDPTALKALKDGAASYTAQDCVVDGLIVTASGPSAAEAFATAIVSLLRTSETNP